MDLSSLGQSLQNRLGELLPNIGFAFLYLLVGWLVALVIRAAVRKGLGLLRLDEKVEKSTGSRMKLTDGVAAGAYFIVLILAFMAALNQLQLGMVSAPLETLLNKIMAYLPNLIAGGVLILIAWFLATLLKKGAVAALATTGLDDKLSKSAGVKPMSENLGNVVYAFVLLLFLPAILGALALEGLLQPVQSMLEKILGMLPNILSGLVLGFVGWFVAKLLGNLVTNLLAATGLDKLGERAGLKGTMTLSRLIGLVVFIFVFVPALIAALNAAKIDVIAAPATQMLESMMTAIPNIFAAGLILTIAFFVSELVGNLIAGLLGGMGFDGVPEKLGLAKLLPGETTPSGFVGKLVVFFVMLFAIVEAAGVLGFYQVSDIVGVLIRFGGQVLLGLVIIAVGLWISNLAHAAVSRLGSANSTLAAGLIRFAILGIVFAMGLRAMEIADDIVNMAFFLTLGAIAVAVALSFGLGGREAAGKQMEHWLSRTRDRGQEP